MVEIEQPAKPRPTPDGASSPVVVPDPCLRPDKLTAEPLVKAFDQIMIDESPDQVPQVTLAEDHKRVKYGRHHRYVREAA